MVGSALFQGLMSTTLGKRKREGPTKRRRRLKRPRKPKTAYNFYQLNVRESVCQEVWDLIGKSVDKVLHNEHVARIIGRRWRAMPEEQRRQYQDMADNDKDRYQREKEVYESVVRRGEAPPTSSSGGAPVPAVSPSPLVSVEPPSMVAAQASAVAARAFVPPQMRPISIGSETKVLKNAAAAGAVVAGPTPALSAPMPGQSGGGLVPPQSPGKLAVVAPNGSQADTTTQGESASQPPTPHTPAGSTAPSLGAPMRRNGSSNSLTRSASGAELFMMGDGKMPRAPSYPIMAGMDL